MALYQNEINAVIRLDTGVDNLDTATELLILVQKPSGTTDSWTASQYQASSQITYVTQSGDLDEVGSYTLQASLKWGTDGPYLGDSTSVTVYASYEGRLNVSHLITVFGVYYRYISVQKYYQYNLEPQDGTDSDILYESFDMYSELAADELDLILSSRGITLTQTQKYVALCHLVADYYEMGEPDWSYRSQGISPGVSFSRGEDTGPRLALNKMLDQIEKASKLSNITGVRRSSTDVKRIKDASNYPRRFKRTSIPSVDFSSDGYDYDEVSDLGGNDYDRSY